jgi:hypothetical protein
MGTLFSANDDGLRPANAFLSPFSGYGTRPSDDGLVVLRGDEARVKKVAFAPEGLPEELGR